MLSVFQALYLYVRNQEIDLDVVMQAASVPEHFQWNPAKLLEEAAKMTEPKGKYGMFGPTDESLFIEYVVKYCSELVKPSQPSHLSLFHAVRAVTAYCSDPKHKTKIPETSQERMLALLQLSLRQAITQAACCNIFSPVFDETALNIPVAFLYDFLMGHDYTGTTVFSYYLNTMPLVDLKGLLEYGMGSPSTMDAFLKAFFQYVTPDTIQTLIAALWFATILKNNPKLWFYAGEYSKKILAAVNEVRDPDDIHINFKIAQYKCLWRKAHEWDLPKQRVLLCMALTRALEAADVDPGTYQDDFWRQTILATSALQHEIRDYFIEQKAVLDAAVFELDFDSLYDLWLEKNRALRAYTGCVGSVYLKDGGIFAYPKDKYALIKYVFCMRCLEPDFKIEDYINYSYMQPEEKTQAIQEFQKIVTAIHEGLGKALVIDPPVYQEVEQTYLVSFSLLQILQVLRDNLESMHDRRSWFTFRRTTKKDTLLSVSAQLANGTLGVQEAYTQTKKICAEKRNPLGFFKTHASRELEALCQEYQFKV